MVVNRFFQNYDFAIGKLKWEEKNILPSSDLINQRFRYVESDLLPFPRLFALLGCVNQKRITSLGEIKEIC